MGKKFRMSGHMYQKTNKGGEEVDRSSVDGNRGGQSEVVRSDEGV